ncbi:MAG: nucleotide sugar dehydrogenase [Victivallales bacterium]|nr:nucleotide sugar dehydrogenase [Victivallales bacterium]
MKDKIAIIGLGYVGLPLAVELGKITETIGYDIQKWRIDELGKAYDRTKEIRTEELQSAQYLKYTTDINKLREANIYIITVPTPIDKYKQPDLTPLYRASTTVGAVLSPGDIVIYESTVFPGCTEEECVPVLEKLSGLKYNKDFYCGYSPERINPGDKEHSVRDITKVTSGSTPETAEKVDQLYKRIITAGTHLASSLKVAEAAKVIENSQRDLNIAFVNELSKIFTLLGIDTTEVLEAAGTKWNFLPFRPGLVGGHCIGVDPYYLTHKAQAAGYHPEVILSGRRINDTMGKHIANEIVKLMINKGHKVKGSNILVMGITFKENCPDIRNSKAIDLVNELKDFGCHVKVYDPWANIGEVKEEYGIELSPKPNCDEKADYDAVILSVSHEEFKDFDFSKFTKDNVVIYDIKSFLDKKIIDKRL